MTIPRPSSRYDPSASEKLRLKRGTEIAARFPPADRKAVRERVAPNGSSCARTPATPIGRNGEAILQRLCPRKSRSQNRRQGRSSGFRIVLLAAPSRGLRPCQRAVAGSGFRSVRTRLQRRDRNGFTPFSLFFFRDHKSRKTPSVEGHQSITAAAFVNESIAVRYAESLCDFDIRRK